MMFIKRYIRRKGYLIKLPVILFLLFILIKLVFHGKNEDKTINSLKNTSQDKILEKKIEAPNMGVNFINYVKTHNQVFKNYTVQDSSYKCLGKQNVYTENDRRGCIFKNICYSKLDRKFVFYNPTKRPVFYDKKFGPLMDFGKDFVSMSPLFFFRNYFTPMISNQDYPVTIKRIADKTIEFKQLHVYWSRKNLNLKSR